MSDEHNEILIWRCDYLPNKKESKSAGEVGSKTLGDGGLNSIETGVSYKKVASGPNHATLCIFSFRPLQG